MTDAAPDATIVDRPAVRFGRAICGTLNEALRREWLVTNGLGGFASGTLAGAPTRRYHGLLVAARNPPVDRVVLVEGLLASATLGDRTYALATTLQADGAPDADGFRHQQAFHLAGAVPVWTFALGGTVIALSVWMARGAHTTYLHFRRLSGDAPEVRLTFLTTRRDFHTLYAAPPGWTPEIRALADEVQVIQPDAPPLRVLASDGGFSIGPAEWQLTSPLLPAERARGQDDRSFSVAAVALYAPLGADLTVALTIEPGNIALDGAARLAAEQDRAHALLRQAGVEDDDPAVQQLVLAADQCIVQRAGAPDAPPGRTVIAGYHWFNDWGRDTMIALPGLTLATGRPDDAADILRTFARYLRDGLVPNNFPDASGQAPGYHTADATLWYVVALQRYLDATGDQTLADELLPALRAIVAQHSAGTRFGIGLDHADGLLRAGEPGVQLTWMDVKIGGWVVTPRTGKPVEINALWYNALRIVAGLLRARGDADADRLDGLAEQARTAFRARFVRPGTDQLADVVDGPDGDDWSLRPNQIFAVALPHPLLDGEDARRVVESTRRALWTSYGLRSLAPDDPRYAGTYAGGPAQRDAVYHQGTVWSWLSGSYAEALWRVTGDRAAARAVLAPFADHLLDAGLGTIAEIFDGDPPHTPRGAIAQAWSVAEVLRVWRRLSDHEMKLA